MAADSASLSPQQLLSLKKLRLILDGGQHCDHEALRRCTRGCEKLYLSSQPIHNETSAERRDIRRNLDQYAFTVPKASRIQLQSKAEGASVTLSRATRRRTRSIPTMTSSLVDQTASTKSIRGQLRSPVDRCSASGWIRGSPSPLAVQEQTGSSPAPPVLAHERPHRRSAERKRLPLQPHRFPSWTRCATSQRQIRKLSADRADPTLRSDSSRHEGAGVWRTSPRMPRPLPRPAELGALVVHSTL